MEKKGFEARMKECRGDGRRLMPVPIHSTYPSRDGQTELARGFVKYQDSLPATYPP